MAPFSSSLAFNSAPLPLFIIALLLVRSKPATIPIKAYLAELRALLKGEGSSDDNSHSLTYLDTIAYWRTAFSVSHEENSSLRARIIKLEGRKDNDSIKKTCPPRKEDGNTRVLRGKRKISSPIAPARPTRPVKQARLANISSPMQSRYRDIRLANPGAGSVATLPVTSNTPDTPADEFLYHVNILQRLKSNRTSVPEIVAFYVQKSFQNIDSLVSIAHQPEAQNQTKEQSHTNSQGDVTGTETPIITHLNIVGSMIPVILQAIDHATQTNQRQALEGSIIHTFVKTYSSILHQVCTLAALKMPSSNIAASITNTSTRARGKWPMKNNTSEPAKSPVSKQSQILLSLSDLAIAMTSALRPADPIHQRMLEGCLSLLLTKIGSGLQIFIFGTGAINEATSKVPHEEEEADGRERDPLATEADRILESQAPYLIYILKGTPMKLPSANNHNNHDYDDSISSYSAPSQTERQTQTEARNQAHKPTMSAVALHLTKRKLQNTLLEAVFPEDTLGLMKERLKAPPSPPPLTASQQQQVPGDEALDIKEWYKQEVLRLVGWDALDDYLKVSIW